MSIKTILTPYNGTDEAQPALDVAFTLGRDLGAHVNVLHVSANPQDSVPLLGEGMSAAIIEEMLQLSENESSERASRAQLNFDKTCGRYATAVAQTSAAGKGASAEFSRETGREDEILAVKGRLSDLIVAAQPVGDNQAVSMMTINAALFETGRPVVIAPPSFPATGALCGRKVVVSWNGSAEASRAVAAAMPLITRAESVVVLRADGDKSSSDMASELVAYFAWHGINADTKLLNASGSHVGPDLLDECGAVGADLLVMGAYTHSRMRQLILGGVTRHILSESQIPVLMAH